MHTDKKRISTRLDHSPFGLMLLDETGSIIQVNGQLLTILSVHQDQLLNKTITEVWQQQDIAPPLDTIKKDVYQHRYSTQKVTVKLRCGTKKSLLCRIYLVPWEQTGRFVRLIEIEDRSNNPGKTERKPGRFTLKDALLQINERICVLDPSGNIIFANCLPSSFVGHKYLDVAYGGRKFDQTGNYLSHIIKAWETKTDIVNEKHRDPTTGRTERITIRHLRDAQQRVVGVMGIYTDITVEQQLKERLKKLEELGSLGRLASATVHEIKNPLTGIRALAQMGSMVSDTDRKDDMFQRIIKQLDSLNEFLNELSLLGRTHTEYLMDTNPHAIIDSVLDLLQGEVELQGIKLTTNFARHDITLPLAPGLFKQAMLNVAKNAIQSLDVAGELEIRTRITNGYFIVTIRDDGCGMSPDVISKLGTPFFTTKSTGSGLGLAITMQIVHQTHKGQTHIASEPDQGTTITMEFPLEHTDRETQAPDILSLF